VTQALDGTREILPGILEFEDRSPLTYGGKAFLIVGPKYNVMVDTPSCTRRVIEAVRASGGLRYIFLSHRDEIGEIEGLRRELGGAVIAHRTEADLVPGGADLVFDTDFEVEPGLWVVHTPGHSPGSACLLLHRDGRKVLFTGDHVLRKRDDIPAPLKFPWTWDWEEQLQSTVRLLELDFDFMVPSHGLDMPRGYFDGGRALLARSLADAAVRKGVELDWDGTLPATSIPVGEPPVPRQAGGGA
jgi:glyoxylase-like metal-dependent hydrolase (beta-lactamase superfamily II)